MKMAQVVRKTFKGSSFPTGSPSDVTTNNWRKASFAQE